MPLINLDDDDQRWVPTHVNVTVLRARGLRTKGKHGSRYVYTTIQVGKEKYTTGLVEKATVPEWNEECSFELLPGLLEAGGTSAYPPGSSNLVLNVMHRVLIGLDVFLGQTIVPLDQVFQDGMCPRDEWLKLHSKAGRKEKERGELQVTVQFTRNNLTASMYDLSDKDKPRSAFGKLKDRVTGRKRGDVESSSAIVPGRYAALSGTLGQPFGEGEGEEDPAEEEVVEERRSKVKDFFLKGKLRKNSDTRSCSSLASESSVGSSAGEPFCPQVELSSTPVYSSKVLSDGLRGDTEGVMKVFTSPRAMTHKRAHSDEAGEITATVPRPGGAVESLKGQSMTLSKSTLCINGSHVYAAELACPKSHGSLPAKRALLEKCSPLSRSLQNLTRRGSEDPQKGTAGDGRRWSFDKTKKEEGEAPETPPQGGAEEGRPVQASPPDMADRGKKLRKTLFSGATRDSLPAKAEQSQASAPHEGRLRGWFGSSDSQNKPRLEVSPKVESSSHTAPPLPPCSPNRLPCSPPLASATGPVSPGNGHHTNPFTNSSPTSAPISPSNPFLTRMQRNPFFEELIAEEVLKSPPASRRHGSPLYHHTALPGRSAIPSPARDGMQNEMAAMRRERPRSVARQRSLPALLSGAPGSAASSISPSTSANRSLSECGGEWDESFEAFAASRLQSPRGTPTQQPSQALSSQRTNAHPHEGYSAEPKNEVRVSEELQKQRDVPPLPPRRPIKTPIKESCRDHWLDRAQELAVQKEARLLSQTDMASLQHAREVEQKKGSLFAKELFTDSSVSDLCIYPAAQQLNMNPTAHVTNAVDKPKDVNLETVRSEEYCWRRVVSKGDLSHDEAERLGVENVNNALNSLAFDIANNNPVNNPPSCVREGVFESFVHSEYDLALPSVPGNSDYEATVAELPCTSPLKFPKADPEPLDIAYCAKGPMPKSSPLQQSETKFTTDISSLLVSTQDPNKTPDSSEFTYIDSDSSPSEVILNTFEMCDKDTTKGCQDISTPSSLGDVMPHEEMDLLCRMTSEIEMFNPKNPGITEIDADRAFEQSAITGDEPADKHHETCEGRGSCELTMTACREYVNDLKDSSASARDCLQKSPIQHLKNEAGDGITKETTGNKSPLNRNGSSIKVPFEAGARENHSFIATSSCDGGSLFSDQTFRALPREAAFDKQNASLPPATSTTPFDRSSPEDVSIDEAPKETLTDRLAEKGELKVELYESFQVSETVDADPELSPEENSEVEHYMLKHMSFEDLHARVAPSSRSPSKTGPSKTEPGPEHSKTDPGSELCVHDSAPSARSLVADTNAQPDPPTPVMSPPNVRPTAGSTLAVAPYTTPTAQPRVDARHTLLPEETQPASSFLPRQESSPHPVKPLNTTAPQAEKKSEGRSVLEKLKSSIHPGRSAQQTAAEVSVQEARAQYQSMTNMELIALLLQQEVDGEKQRAEAELQAALLEKREAELRKMKVQVRDLEDYIDKLLVRIMEQTPTLLQVRSRHK